MMRLPKIILSALVHSVLFLGATAHADDTDIYLSVNSRATGDPFLMLILDWRPDVIGSNACTFYTAFSTDNNGCDKKFGYGPIGHMIRLANQNGLTNWADGQALAPTDAFRAVFAALVMGYKVVKRDDNGDPITIGLTQCSDSDARPDCFQTYDGIGRVNLGLMLAHANKSVPGDLADCPAARSGSRWNEGCSNGAYVLKGFETFAALGGVSATWNTGSARYRTLQKLYALPFPAGGSDAHPYQGKEVYAELHRYLTGGAILNAHNAYQDFGTSGTGLAGVCQTGSEGDGTTRLDSSCEGGGTRNYSWDTTIESGVDYVEPLGSGNECSKMYAINTVSGQVNQEDDSDDAIEADMGLSRPRFPDVIGYMYQTDDYYSENGVTSYFLSQSTSTTVNGWAAAGGTAAAIPYGSDLNQLLLSLQNIASQILSVSTTFVAASIPVSAFNRVLSDENFYIALFRSDPAGLAYWPGNLKRLKIVEQQLDDGTYALRIVARDVTDTGTVDAFDPTDGRLNWYALTYWTNQGALPAVTDPIYQSVPENVENMVAGADGRVVERGGAGQKIPGFTAPSPGLSNSAGGRKLYTEPLTAIAAGSNGMIALDASDAMKNDAQLQDLFGVGGDSDKALKLLKYARGLETTASVPSSPARKWITGSAIHSRPFPINYGKRATSDAKADIRIFMGTNDGWFRQFKNTTGAGSDLGTEIMAFMPHEAMAIQRFLVAGDPFAADDPDFATPFNQGVPYGVDGPVAAYLDYGSDSRIIGDSSASGYEAADKAYVYFGMRRGGYGYYALNVTDPDNTRLAWTAKKTDADFAELGMTFSQPKLAHIKYNHFGTSDIRVLIFGGGYNGGWSGTSRVGKDASAGSDGQGNAIYIVNAETGALIWKATDGGSTGASSNTLYTHTGLDHSIPSDVAVVDINGDGYDDAAFVGDTGGNVWRIDFPSYLGTAAAVNHRQNNWKLTKVAALANAGTDSEDQRFFAAPEVVRSRDANGDFLAISIGSGNREDPLDLLGDPTDPPENWFYMIKDRNVFSTPTSEAPLAHTDLDDVTSDCITPDACNATLANGWRLSLGRSGEKAVTEPVVRLGTLFFTTYTPPDPTQPDSCTPGEGFSSVYAVGLSDAAPTKNYNLTDGGRTSLDRYRDLETPGIVPLPQSIITTKSGDVLMFPGSAPEDIIKIPPLPVFWYDAHVDQ